MPFELSDTIRGLFKVRFLHSQQVENGLIKYVSGNNTCQYFSHFMVFTTSKASYELHLPQHTYTNEHWQKNNEIYIRSKTIKAANFIQVIIFYIIPSSKAIMFWPQNVHTISAYLNVTRFEELSAFVASLAFVQSIILPFNSVDDQLRNFPSENKCDK